MDSLGEKNSEIGELWKGLSSEDKEKYFTMAKEESLPGVGHTGDWKNVSRVLTNMNDNVSVHVCDGRARG